MSEYKSPFSLPPANSSMYETTAQPLTGKQSMYYIKVHWAPNTIVYFKKQQVFFVLQHYNSEQDCNENIK